MTADDVDAFERCLAAGGVALFPSDTVYGLAADAESGAAVQRLNDLKRRSRDMPAAVMFFSLDAALAAVPALGRRTRAALARLLPGPVTVLVPNPERRFLLAGGRNPERLGLRVPALTGPLEPLRSLDRPVLQSSANLHGGEDPRRIEDVPVEIRTAVDLELDGGELPGTASTVVDLSLYEDAGRYELVREGAMAADRLADLV